MKHAEVNSQGGSTEDPASEDFCSGGGGREELCIEEGTQEPGRARAWARITGLQGAEVRGLREALLQSHVSSEHSHHPAQALPAALRPELPLCLYPSLPSCPECVTVSITQLGEMAPVSCSFFLPCESWGVMKPVFLLGKCHCASLRTGAYQAEHGHSAATEPARSLHLGAGGLCGHPVGKSLISGLQNVHRGLLGPRDCSCLLLISRYKFISAATLQSTQSN